MFRMLDMFQSSGDGKETPTLLGRLESGNQWLKKLTLSKRFNRIGVPFSSSEDWNRYSFPNVVFSIFQFRTMDKVQNPSNSEYMSIASGNFEMCLVHMSLSIGQNYFEALKQGF
jgi:hypothetical protein